MGINRDAQDLSRIIGNDDWSGPWMSVWGLNSSPVFLLSHLGFEILELIVTVGEGPDFGWANKSEV